MKRAHRQDPRLERIDENQLRLPNRWDIPVRVLARPEVAIERVAIDELLGVLETQELLRAHPGRPAIAEVVLTPDAHKGAGIPIGTVLATRGAVLPQAVGNDVNCGMRLSTTDLSVDQVSGRLDALAARLRHVFFEGGRRLALSPVAREALLVEGLPGLLETAEAAGGEGLWAFFRPDEGSGELDRVHGGGRWSVGSIEGLEDFVAGSGGRSYDSQLGSIGGGNHFVEIQSVRRILDGPAAHAWGLVEGRVVVMVHSGSLGLGHRCGARALDLAREHHPAGLAHPASGIYPLPAPGGGSPAVDRYRGWLGQAVHFAFANRFFLALMVRSALEATIGPSRFETLYDAPHNLVWEEDLDGRPAFVHRKGATPAGGWEGMASTPYAGWGEPVLVPGSMGSPSYVLRGLGERRSLASAAHGAGRALSRGAALAADGSLLDEFLDAFRIVTPLDPDRPEVRRRPDLVRRWRRSVQTEAPFAYKDVGPVVETLDGAGVARPVAELHPLLTVKA